MKPASASTEHPAPPNFRQIPLLELRTRANIRKSFDPEQLAELTESVRRDGVLQPILVRPIEGHFEIVAGERRFRAATAAGLSEIPAMVHELDEERVVEIQLIENLRRADLHPLEEAEGYAQLHRKGHDVVRIAERVGRSPKYVYDRMKLNALTKEAKRLFLEDRFSAGHAILLARLSAKDQARAINPGNKGGYRYGRIAHGLWEDERTLYEPDDDGIDEKERLAKEKAAGPYAGLKAVSVRELEAWIDKNVRLEPVEVDQMVLPETAAALENVTEESVKVLRITYDEITPAGLKGGAKAILGRSWRRADGKAGSKSCERARLGMIVIGPHRGEALQVCVDKKACAVHWPEHVKGAKRQKKAVRDAVAKGENAEAARAAARKLEEERRRIEAERSKKAFPAVMEALASAVKKAKAGATGPLGERLVRFVEDNSYRDASKGPSKLVPRGKTAEDLIRHLAFIDLWCEMEDLPSEHAVKAARAFGVDVKKILDDVAPPLQTSAKDGKAAPAKKARP